jgi:hypothetical protein
LLLKRKEFSLEYYYFIFFLVVQTIVIEEERRNSGIIFIGIFADIESVRVFCALKNGVVFMFQIVTLHEASLFIYPKDQGILLGQDEDKVFACYYLLK